MTKKNYIFYIFIVISFFLTVFFVGLDNIWFKSTNWLYGSGDPTNAQLGWKFFAEDIWRFPIGKNPKYGLEVSNSIVFSDSIPLFAILFKLFKKFITHDIQYFSFWIFLNFFLQLFLAYKIFLKATKNNYFSFFASFLLLCPFMFYRLSHHFALGAHWLILFTLYIFYFANDNKKKIYWYIVIFLSILIHLYFTLMIFAIYSLYSLEKGIKNINLISEFFELIKKILFSLFTMYLVGYFEASPIDKISTGFGKKKFDLLGFFDPQIDEVNRSWSIFFPNLGDTSLEGFSYIGAGNILLILSAMLIFVIKKKFQNINVSHHENIYFRLGNLYLPLFFFWSISTSVSFMGKEILSFDLPKYLLGLLSIFSASGRFIWPVIYFLIIFLIIFIFKNFSKKNSLFLILFLLIAQIIDVTKGIYENSIRKNIKVEENYNEIWKFIEKNYSKVRTTYHFNNYGPIFTEFSKILGNMNNLETDIILNAAMNRQKSAELRYDLVNKIISKSMPKDTAYIIDNLGHFNQLKNTFITENYGFFFRDKFMIMLPENKDKMNKSDIQYFNSINPKEVILDKENYLFFKDDFLGFGWSHNFNNQGVWSDGENSFLILSLPATSKKNLIVEINYDLYSGNNNDNFGIKIFANEILQKEINFYKNKNIKKISFNLDKTYFDSDILKFHLKFSGLVSPFEIFESPDVRKLGILLKSFRIFEKS